MKERRPETGDGRRKTATATEDERKETGDGRPKTENCDCKLRLKTEDCD
ncbi:hypothetical protein [Subsaximicrobium wynnwilliamsii]|nr:hypothetical protein [Subsaximicrobium wynnwilliamsii]